MSSIFEAYFTDKSAWQLSIEFCVVHVAKSKYSLKDYFEENVKI